MFQKIYKNYQDSSNSIMLEVRSLKIIFQNHVPGYDGVPDLFKQLALLLREMARHSREARGVSALSIPQTIQHTVSVDKEKLQIDASCNAAHKEVRFQSNHWI